MGKMDEHIFVEKCKQKGKIIQKGIRFGKRLNRAYQICKFIRMSTID